MRRRRNSLIVFPIAFGLMILMILISLIPKIITCNALPMNKVLKSAVRLGRYNFFSPTEFVLQRFDNSVFIMEDFQIDKNNVIKEAEESAYIKIPWQSGDVAAHITFNPEIRTNAILTVDMLFNNYYTCHINYLDYRNARDVCLVYPIGGSETDQNILLLINNSSVEDSPFGKDLEGLYLVSLASDCSQAERINFPTYCRDLQRISANPSGDKLILAFAGTTQIYNIKTKQFSKVEYPYGYIDPAFSKHERIMMWQNYSLLQVSWNDNNTVRLIYADTWPNPTQLNYFTLDTSNLKKSQIGSSAIRFLTSDKKYGINTKNGIEIIDIIDMSVKYFDCNHDIISDSDEWVNINYCPNQSWLLYTAENSAWDKEIFLINLTAGISYKLSTVFNDVVSGEDYVQLAGITVDEQVVLACKNQFYLVDPATLATSANLIRYKED